MSDLEEEGYQAYLDGKNYSYKTNVHWLNGWAKAERETRGGHFDRHGRHTPCYG